MRRVTIKDVAEKAGVSKSTVSHVINKTRHVESDTEQKVVAAILELGYRPSSIARSLVSKRTKTAGLLVSNVGNPYYPEVIYGAEEVALANEYQLFLCNTGYNSDRGLRIVNSLIDKQVDGVLCLSSSLADTLIDELVDNNLPMVTLITSNAPRNDRISTITINFRTGIFQAIEHLVHLGHRRIALISGPNNLWTSKERRALFLEALSTNGIDPQDITEIEGDLRISGGRQALQQLLHIEPRPTAILAANDLMALGAMWEALKNEISVPGDLSVIGLDDIELSAAVSPPLTTISLPRYEIGKMAMEILLKMLEHQDMDDSQRTYQEIVVDTKLVVRQSTAQPSGQSSAALIV